MPIYTSTTTSPHVTPANPTSVLVRRSGGTDRNGDQLPAVEHVIDGCTWWPRQSTETNNQGNAVIVGLTLTGPVGADIRAEDEVVFVEEDGGDPWYVEGEPGRRVSPFGSSSLDHFEVALNRRRG